MSETRKSKNVVKSPTTSPDLMTKESLNSALPRGVSLTITPELLAHVNNLLKDEDLQQNFRENLISFTSVLKEGRFKADSYVSAVQYVSLKLLGNTNEGAYSKTFPDRYNKMLANGKSDKDISSFVAAYHKSKLVGLVMAQTLTPAWVYNQGAYQEAINKQLSIMRNEDASFKVQSDAANSLLTHLKQPEAAKVELDIAVKEDSALGDLQRAMRELVQSQRQAIQEGKVSVQGVAHTRIIPKDQDEILEGDYVEK